MDSFVNNIVDEIHLHLKQTYDFERALPNVQNEPTSFPGFEQIISHTTLQCHATTFVPHVYMMSS